MHEKIEIRTIRPVDNKHITAVIQNTLIEFDGNKPGTAFNDPGTTNTYQAYQGNDEVYYVAILNGVLVGGCGIGHLEGAEKNICELQKMYISEAARGKKIGKRLLEKCISFATKSGYKQCYLETFPHMYAAKKLYSKNGFKFISKPMGSTGHTACDVWMLKDLNP